MYHTRKIGIFISHIFGEYQRRLCQGVTDRASEYGFITEIFTSTDGENLGTYAQGEHSILQIPNFNLFSGIVFASGTYPQQDLRQQIADTLKRECSCPVLEITQSDPQFPCLSLDNDRCAVNLTTHLIETHHCRRICYLGNEKETFFSNHRLSLYRRVLAQHGMVCRNEDTCQCSYEKSSIASGLSFLLQDDTAPDAIICYNDRMAVLLMELLQEKGFCIPDDIRVTGFDNLEIGRNICPDLTTVTFPLYEAGVRAFDLLLEASSSGASLPDFTIIEAAPIYRGSCCPEKAAKGLNPLPYENALQHALNTQESSMLEDIRLSSSLYSITDLDEGMDLLEEYVSGMENCREFYICLYPDWNHISGRIQRLTSAPDDLEDTDTMLMPFAFRDGKRLPSCTFTKKNLLPDYLYTHANPSYICAPLFFGERAFGYAAFSFREGSISARFEMLIFLRNINTLLKCLCDLRQTDLLLDRLESISGKDELTSLLNRQGFRLAARKLLQQAISAKGQLLSMQFFLNDLPEITRLCGRAERDFAICVAGHALESAVMDGACVSHQGGGEFLFLTTAEQDKAGQAEEIEACVSNYLKHYNKLHTKPYDISLSCTHRITAVTAGTEIMELFPW